MRISCVKRVTEAFCREVGPLSWGASRVELVVRAFFETTLVWTGLASESGNVRLEDQRMVDELRDQLLNDLLNPNARQEDAKPEPRGGLPSKAKSPHVQVPITRAARPAADLRATNSVPIRIPDRSAPDFEYRYPPDIPAAAQLAIKAAQQKADLQFRKRIQDVRLETEIEAALEEWFWRVVSAGAGVIGALGIQKQWDVNRRTDRWKSLCVAAAKAARIDYFHPDVGRRLRESDTWRACDDSLFQSKEGATTPEAAVEDSKELQPVSEAPNAEEPSLAQARHRQPAATIKEDEKAPPQHPTATNVERPREGSPQSSPAAPAQSDSEELADTQSAKAADARENVLEAHGAEPWHLRLRAARAKLELSRTELVMRLKVQGVQITADAIKKHEEGKAMPKPDVRTAYAAIYKTTEAALFS